MNPFTHRAKRSVVGLAILFISFATLRGQTPPPSAQNTASESQLNMLVLGDSILWGQGLKEEHKAWYQVKVWLQQTAGREVQEKIEAHSGALLVGETAARAIIPEDHEVNSAVPTITEQLDDARRFFPDPSRIDLVLVDGCINDVSVFNLLNAGNTIDGISQLANTKCGQPMTELLARTSKSFPNALIIVTGYFPIISEKTPNSLLLRAIARLLYRQPSTPAAPLKTAQLRDRLVAISQSWYQSSNHALAEAVRQANIDLSARQSRQRVHFVEISFSPEYAFAAKETRLWGFDSSFLRKLLAVLTLGKVTLKTDDERRNQRVVSCNDFYRRPQTEDKQQRRDRELRRLLCYYASIGHPNRKGAEIYSAGIIEQLKLMIAEVGWIRDLRTNPTPTAPVR
jgi:hypothetical protein